MYSAAHLCVAGHIDVDGAIAAERVHLVVCEHLVVDAEPARELGAALAAEADHLDALAARQQERQRAGRLARGAGEDRRARAEQRGFVEEVVDQIRREEQRAQQHLLGLGAGVVDRVGVDARVAVVSRRKLGAVRGGVDEALRADRAPARRPARSTAAGSRTRACPPAARRRGCRRPRQSPTPACAPSPRARGRSSSRTSPRRTSRR